MAVFVPRLSAYEPTRIEGNYWWYQPGNYPLGNPFAGGIYGMPNCTCYAYGRYAEVRGAFADLPTGNAGDWYPNATAFSRGQTPQLGAIACYNHANYAGHVAVVEQINTDGSIVTSNSGYHSTYFWTETAYPSNNYVTSWMRRYPYYFQGFIYQDGTYALSPYVISAICGNWKQESNVNPGLWEGLVPVPFTTMFHGFGLGQWTNTSSDNDAMRLRNLHDFLRANNYTDDSGEGQLAFFIKEDYWHIGSHPSAYRNLSDFLTSSSTNISDLVSEFMLHWEGINDGTFNVRLAAAQMFYQYIYDHASDDPSTYHWIASNNYLTDAEMCNNVMCIYFWFSRGIPVPPQPIITDNKMKLWEYLKPQWRRRIELL